jgi:hypothetical protein
MDLTVIQAKIAAGVLPQTNGAAERAARYVSGVCIGCDGTITANEIGIQLCGPRHRGLLHADCYVTWTKVCAEHVVASPLCSICDEAIQSGTPRYRLGALGIVHLACRDSIKPRWPRLVRQGHAPMAR